MVGDTSRGTQTTAHNTLSSIWVAMEGSCMNCMGTKHPMLDFVGVQTRTSCIYTAILHFGNIVWRDVLYVTYNTAVSQDDLLLSTPQSVFVNSTISYGAHCALRTRITNKTSHITFTTHRNALLRHLRKVSRYLRD